MKTKLDIRYSDGQARVYVDGKFAQQATKKNAFSSLDCDKVRDFFITFNEYVPSVDLSLFPDFKKLHRLSFGVHMFDVPKDKTIRVDFEQLKSRERVRLLEFGYLPIMPENLSLLTSLNQLSVSACNRMVKSLDLSKSHTLKELFLGGISVSSLSLQLPPSCQTLKLSSFSPIDNLDFISPLTELTDVVLDNFKRVKSLNLTSINKLKNLSLYGFTNLQDLRLSNMKLDSLVISKCNKLSADVIVSACQQSSCRSLAFRSTSKICSEVKHRLEGKTVVL